MGTNLKFNSAICTSREQSERLLALGLKKETADMKLIPYSRFAVPVDYYTNIYGDDPDENDFCRAWSLHRLIEMIPSEIHMEDYYLILGVSFNCVYYADNEYAEVFQSFDRNTYSCIINCIEWLIKEGNFCKEYLEE